MSLRDLLREAKAPRDDDGEAKRLDLKAQLDSFLLNRRATAPPRKSRGRWYPSSINKKEFCPRAGVLGKRHDEPYDPFIKTNELERILDIGTWVHRGYQEDYLGPMGILWGDWRCSRCHGVVTGFMPKDSCSLCQWKGDERDLTPGSCQATCALDSVTKNDTAVEERGGCVRCSKWGRWEYMELRVSIPELHISGRIDGLLAHIPYGVLKVVWDLKTCNDQRFGFIAMADTPPERDFKQLQLYLKGLKEKGTIADDAYGMLTYANKNDHRLHSFHVDYDPNVIRREVRFAKLMNEALENGTTPKRSEKCKNAQTKRAKECAVAHLCFAEGETE